MTELEYHKYSIDNAINKVSAILEKYNDHPHALEYYTAMQETMIALSFAMTECKNYSRMYGRLLARVENLEMALAAERRAKVA